VQEFLAQHTRVSRTYTVPRLGKGCAGSCRRPGPLSSTRAEIRQKSCLGGGRKIKRNGNFCDTQNSWCEASKWATRLFVRLVSLIWATGRVWLHTLGGEGPTGCRSRPPDRARAGAARSRPVRSGTRRKRSLWRLFELWVCKWNLLSSSQLKSWAQARCVWWQEVFAVAVRRQRWQISSSFWPAWV